MFHLSRGGYTTAQQRFDPPDQPTWKPMRGWAVRVGENKIRIRSCQDDHGVAGTSWTLNLPDSLTEETTVSGNADHTAYNRGAPSQGKASTIWRAVHSEVGWVLDTN
jgi:hypothetical protein